MGVERAPRRGHNRSARQAGTQCALSSAGEEMPPAPGPACCNPPCPCPGSTIHAAATEGHSLEAPVVAAEDWRGRRDTLSAPHELVGPRRAPPITGNARPGEEGPGAVARTRGRQRSAGAPGDCLVDQVNDVPAPGQRLEGAVAGGLREHFRPEESPADVDTLEELNPSLVTLVPDFGFAPSGRGKFPRKEQQRKDSPSNPEKKRHARRVRTQEDSLEVTKGDNSKASGKEGAPLKASPSAQVMMPRVVERKKGDREGKLIGQANVPSSTCRVADAGGEGPGATADCTIGAAAAGNDGVTERERRDDPKQAAAGRGKREASQAGGGVRAVPRRTVDEALQQSRLEPLPFHSVFGAGCGQKDCNREEARPAASERGVLPRRATNAPGSAVTSQQSTVGRTTPAVGAGAEPKSPPLVLPGALLKVPMLRALAREDRTSTFGSASFVVEDFLSSLEPDDETTRGAEEWEPCVSQGRSLVAPANGAGKTQKSAAFPRDDSVRPDGPIECDADWESDRDGASQAGGPPKSSSPGRSWECQELSASSDPDPEDWQSSFTEVYLRKTRAVPQARAEGDKDSQTGKVISSAGTAPSRFSRVVAAT